MEISQEEELKEHLSQSEQVKQETNFSYQSPEKKSAPA